MNYLKDWLHTHKESLRIALHVLLFVLTFITTTIAGAEWAYGKSLYLPDQPYTWADFFSGLPFSISFLSILTVHEFGHYFTASFHRVKSSLPYYIPFPPFPLSIGTMGAIIRLRQRVPSNIQNFDIGIAGPLAGFVLAFAILFYGFSTLPPAEYIFEIHPEYKQYGLQYAEHAYTEKENVLDIVVGKNLLFLFFEKFVAAPDRMPNPHEIMHYPLLFAGFLALVFTSLNLLPIGQLDGGHVLYGLVGFKRHRLIASIVYGALLFYAGLGWLGPGDDEFEFLSFTLPHFVGIPVIIAFYYVCMEKIGLSKRDTLMYASLILAIQYTTLFFFPTVTGYSGWLVFALIIGRVLGVQHPPCLIEIPLDNKRKILGWIALLVFVLCFTPAPITL